MLFEEGKYSILNLKGRVLVIDIYWIKMNVEERIKFRVDLYVKNVLFFNDVVNRYENIVKVIYGVYLIENFLIDIYFFSDSEIELYIYFIRCFLVLF